METKILTETRTLQGTGDAPATGAAGWLKLVGYGEHPHCLGMQVVSRESALLMAKNFHSLVQRLARRFRGVPVYIGHPDDANFRGQVGHGDTRAYGWVKGLDARGDGLWTYIKWSRAGQELIADAHFKFLSPRWEMHPIGEGRFVPKLLVSIGLTNYPNIPTDAIANEVAEAGRDAPPEETEPFPADPPEESLRHQPAMDGAASALVAANGCIPTDLLLHQSLTLDLAQRKIAPNASKRMQEQRLLSLVSERMTSANESFATAWNHVKFSHAVLFDAMTFSPEEKSPNPSVNLASGRKRMVRWHPAGMNTQLTEIKP
jgi:hypothetical protein